MKLTIIREDRAVYKNNVCYFPLDMSTVPVDVHALQWNADSGHIEFINRPNEHISALPTWANTCLAEWEAADYVAKNPPPPTPEELIATCKLIAKQKLEATDYVELLDVSTLLINKSEFTQYRTAVRALYLAPVANPIWPDEPTPVWGTR